MTSRKYALRTRGFKRSSCVWRSQERYALPNPLGSKLNETGMSDLHQAHLSLGSNIQPETNLVRALELLQKYGELRKISNVWESESVGAEGPHYLNVCVLLVTPHTQTGLKEQALLPIEAGLGRQRGADKFAPRTIDIDIVLFDGQSCDDRYWEQAFVVVPLAEIVPEYQN